MTAKLWRLLTVSIGAALLGFFLYRFASAKVWLDLKMIGWRFGLIVALEALVHVVNARAWHFGLVLSPEAEARMSHFIAERPNGGYGRNNYRLEGYGLDAEAERRRHWDYISYFGIGSKGIPRIASREPGARTAEEHV